MSDAIKNAARQYIRDRASRTSDQKNLDSDAQREQAFRDHEMFCSAFRLNDCFVCGQTLDHFNRANLCVHWLLRPNGCTKADIIKTLEHYSLFRIQAYLRWVANEGSPAININDLSDEGSGKLIELTIRYKEFEWAFSCSQGDYDGHKTSSPASNIPHYHFQMRVKKQSFLKYNDLHIALSPDDILTVETIYNSETPSKMRFAGGMGMNDFLAGDTLETLVKEGLSSKGDVNNAHLRVQTILIADEGTMISGDMLADLAEEAKARGVTVASLVHRLPNVSAQLFVTPGPAVVEQAKRTGGRKKTGERPED